MNIFNNLISSLKRFRTGGLLNPEHDWIGLLALSSVAFAGIIVWNIWTFDTVANGGVIGTAATNSPTAFDRSSIDAINDIFEKRATEEIRYRTGVYRFSDPSQ